MNTLRNVLVASLLVLASAASAQEAKDAAAPTAAAPAAANAKGDILLAPKVGFFKTTTPLSGAFYAGLEVGYVTPLLDHKLAIVVEGDWHQPRLAATASDPQLTVNGTTADGGYRLVEREIGVLLSFVYRAEGLVEGVTPYGGLGPGLYLHQATTTAFGNTYTENEGTLGLQALLGAELTLGPGSAFLEVHYHFTNVDFLSTGSVNVGGFLAASVGYRFRF